MPFVMRRNLFFLLVVLTHFGAPNRKVFAVVVQKWPVKLHSNSSVSLEAGENNTIFFDSDVTTIHNKLTLYVDDDVDFSSEFEPAAKALDELEADFFEAFQVAPISLCGGYACAFLDDKSLKCWGYNGGGQLGLGDINNRGDAPGEMGDNLPAVDLGTGRTATAIFCKYSQTCALLDDKSVKCWGNNYNGELGLGDRYSRGGALFEMGDNLPAVDLGTGRTATAVSMGDSMSGYACALLDNKSVKCWGSNYNGQLGLGDTNNRGDAPGEMGDNLPAVDLGTGRTATAIFSGDGGYACALLDDKSLKCWGSNYNGQLGLGDTNNRGDAPGEMGDNLPAVDLGTGRTATAIFCTYSHACALLDNKSVKCWGSNYNGQLGLGDTNNRGDAPGEMGDNLPAVDLGTGRTATAISIGGSHACALLDNKSVKCWGSNYNGQLGLGDTNYRGDAPGEMGDNLPAVDLGTGRTATAISTGGSHTCALLDDKSVKCWGYNYNGELGLGDTNNRGDAPGEMGDNLPAVDLGTGRMATAILNDGSRTCALLDNKSVKCWGYNYSGQLGLGDTNNRGDAPGEMGDYLPAVDLGSNYVPTYFNEDV